jgi:hypothetical protein
LNNVQPCVAHALGISLSALSSWLPEKACFFHER